MNLFGEPEDDDLPQVGSVWAGGQGGSGAGSIVEMLTSPSASVHSRATDTEIAAAEKFAPKAGTLRAMVLDWIRDAGADGMTGKEAGARYALSIGRDENDGSARYSAMPRITELRKLGLIKDSGARRGGSIAWVKS